ncbi:monosaccharide ABC transporter substrate-binding protein, CUT2 family [Novosphingobium sp. CF614]|uniref:substrate-binding domain-containing protein n=1 Tax=Novosphingobium sp. CF614 TaxID=1884364 RepID=UPI0008F0D1EE|nr:substrate-binding domain-containing protein [Novosphingobium sp. CF614]SFG08081.1 monosaccharide ABC transporter substrate-binding protein, CUT2 family [Novosphingobium sp. CF614]
MRRLRRTAATLSLALLALTGCNKSKGEFQVAASFHNLSEPFFVAMRRNAQDEARKLNVDLLILDGQSNSAKQTADIQVVTATGTRGLILAPTDVNALTPAVNDVIDLGIPVVTVDRRVDRSKRPVQHFGADNVAGGRLMAQHVIAMFPQGARILLLTGAPGSSSAIDRTKGIHEAFKAAGPRYAFVAEQTANWQREQGLTVTQNILTSLGGQRPDVIISEDDDMALGALEALRSIGAQGIKVIGFNATPEALRMIREGRMEATVEQSPSRQIRIALDQLVARIRTGKPISGANITPILITRQNLGQAERINELK